MLEIFKRKKKKRFLNGEKVKVFQKNLKENQIGEVMSHTIDTEGNITYIVRLNNEKILRLKENQVKKIK